MGKKRGEIGRRLEWEAWGKGKREEKGRVKWEAERGVVKRVLAKGMSSWQVICPRSAVSWSRS